VRYADDFVITGYSRELLEYEVKPLVEAFLMERGLTLSRKRPESRTSRKGSTSSGGTSENIKTASYSSSHQKGMFKRF
jgi:hypothetical protein